MNFRVVASLALLLTACATARPPVRIRDTPQDFAELKLTDTVLPHEDGRRSSPGEKNYEWWYLDAVAADGTVVVVVFGDNWPVGGKVRDVTIEVTPPGKPTRKARFKTDEAGTFASEHADVHIGSNRFEGDLERYTIHVDPTELQGVGCDLVLERRVKSYRPGTGFMGSGGDFFAWVVAVPEGQISGTISIDGKTDEFRGSGYHDHNWGNVAPWDLMRNWWWGRGEVNGKTVVMSEMRPQKDRGTDNMALLFIAGPEGDTARLHGAAVHLVEGDLTDKEVLGYDTERPKSVTLESTAPGRHVAARFERKGLPTTFMDALANMSGFMRFMARVAGRSPSYTRWRSKVVIDIDGATEEGTGTIEYMDFE